MPILNIQKNISLLPLTTFRLGGEAKFFVKVETKQDLKEAVLWSYRNKQKFFILSGGSNILISDQGFNGLVIKLSNSNIKIKGNRIEVGAGAMLGEVVRLATKFSLGGVEWAIGIPGTVGGAIYGNAGSFGKNIGEIVETTEVFLVSKKDFVFFSHNDCCFSYRHSIFKQQKDKIIWSVILKFYKDNQKEIKNKIEKYLKYRQKSQPKLPSAGCIFKNLNLDYLEKVNPNLAQEAIELGIVKDKKIGAGWLLDKLGLKGKAIGGVKISLEHANFIVNTGKGKAEDVVMLISYIKQQVRDKLGVQLQEEIQYVGF